VVTKGILANYKVLDLADEKGRLCSKLLADMGAEVIRLQKPGEAVSPVYANTGKHCISLNLEIDKGQELFRRLAKNCDIVIQSFNPGYLSSLKLGFSELSQINNQLIMASITDFGMTGSYREKKSSDLVASALGGQMCVCGEPDKPPVKPFGLQAYSTACLFAANGILLALWGRHSSGRGQHIDISIHECVAATLDHVLVRYFYEGVLARRQGSLYWNNAFRVFHCRDGYILLSFFQHWDTLVELLDSEGLAGDLKDTKWLDESERQNNLAHIVDVIEKWTRLHAVDELVELGQLMHFPWAKVASIPEVVDNPQLNERGFFVEVKDAGSGKHYKFPGAPVKMSQSPWQVNPQVSQAGEYNYEIYHNRLGISETEIKQLRRQGVI
jgi:crotonobetainyl-CoA:carnitine CoA-transferase CaiB-like acyl-CoA transferase